MGPARLFLLRQIIFAKTSDEIIAVMKEKGMG